MDFFIFISEQWLLVSAMLIFVYLFAINERRRGGKPIDARAAVGLINASEAILLDVRDAKEYASGHIHGSMNIPYGKLEARVTELNPHQQKVIIVADKLGQHAGSAGNLLTKNGFTVRRLAGGITEWRNQNLPLVSGK